MANIPHSSVYLDTKKDSDRFLITYTLLKLAIVQGKTIIYTNSAEDGYRLHLYLARFGLNSEVLCYEHPKSSRHLVISHFVGRATDLLIVIDPDEGSSPNKDCKRNKIFKVPVSVLLNFDFPSTRGIYARRVADISCPESANFTVLNLVREQDRPVMLKLNKSLRKREQAEIAPLQLKMDEFERFRYRCEDVLRTIADKQIREIRLNELKRTLLSSKELKRHLAENPQDKLALKVTRVKQARNGSTSVPDYLLPDALKPPPVSEDFGIQSHKKRERDGEEVKEDPDSVDWQDLSSLSNRKLWKIKHHFSVKKRGPVKKRRL